jgi:hypothetical protein
MGRWLRTTERASPDPKRPHVFQETNDPGVVAFASGGSTTSGSQVDMLATTVSSLRATRCALPGCGLPRGAAIHAPADD